MKSTKGSYQEGLNSCHNVLNDLLDPMRSQAAGMHRLIRFDGGVIR